jgi:hypothetical protein
MKRVSKKTPPGLSPPDCLRCWGLEKNAATRELFYLAENYERLFEGRIIVGTLAKKWIANVFKRGAARKVAVAGEELNQGNCEGQFRGASLRYFPVAQEDNPGDLIVNNGPEFVTRIEHDINQWLSSRPLPEGHTRFFHGTSASSMTSILQSGMRPTRFQDIGDFGPAFYCADNVRTSIRFAIATALYEVPLALEALQGRYGPMRASLIYFDVKKDDLANLEQLDLDDGDEWTTFTGQCLALAEDGEDITYSGERVALQLVMGKLVHNPHEVEHDEATSEAFGDARRQYAFREKAGDLLLGDKEKVGVALFDVYMDDAEDEDTAN